MGSVAHFITGHLQTQLNRVCYGVFLASKGSFHSELIEPDLSRLKTEAFPAKNCHLDSILMRCYHYVRQL